MTAADNKRIIAEALDGLPRSDARAFRASSPPSMNSTHTKSRRR